MGRFWLVREDDCVLIGRTEDIIDYYEISERVFYDGYERREIGYRGSDEKYELYEVYELYDFYTYPEHELLAKGKEFEETGFSMRELVKMLQGQPIDELTAEFSYRCENEELDKEFKWLLERDKMKLYNGKVIFENEI